MNAISERLWRHAPLVPLLLSVACGQRGEHGNGASPESFEGGEQASGPEDDGGRQLDAAARPLVQTSSGKLRGITSNGVDSFLGVPYARPPVDGRRLAAPEDLDPSEVERSADKPGNDCPQIDPSTSEFKGNEDCLFLNVYRPAKLDPKKPAPVMIWIHGGSFESGAGADYFPERLVRANQIIVVTINYRLGPLGFIAGDGLSADYGLQDQRKAFGWVQNNVKAFGGDPGKVTIAGESAGAGAVCAHVASKSTGLFSRAIIQSGSCGAISLGDARNMAANNLQAGLKKDGIQCENGLAACLRDTTLTAKQLVEKSRATGMKYGIVAGSEVVPRMPYEVVLAHEQQPVPVLIGGIKDEMALFLIMAGGYDSLEEEGYPAALEAGFPALEKPALEEIALLYPVKHYKKPFLALSAAFNDSGVYYFQLLGGCVTAATVSAFSASTSTETYAYELDDPNFQWRGGGTGATHMTDLPYLFDLRVPISARFNAQQQALSQQMIAAWGQFIKGEAPTFGGAEWPRTIDGNAKATYLKPGFAPARDDLFATHNCEFWQKTLTPRANDSPAGSP
ncbi:MAG TPA: carboxylesterase family protein [Polyangiaceae bacterium]|nr:carboxylesterase family protein [Polyangiaceae bacterium]